MKKEVRKIVDTMKKDEMARELIATREELEIVKRDMERYKDWSEDANISGCKMIGATYEGKMPIVTDPVNNIQYLNIVSDWACDTIRKILHKNKYLVGVVFAEGVLIVILMIYILFL